jgi:hypothetical protein
MSPSLNPELQHDVQRLLGRCMLRIQQYERLMKTILTHQEISGAIHEMAAHQASRAERFADKSLGTLVKSLFESYVVEEGTEPRVDKEPTVLENQPSFSVKFQIQMTKERRAQTLEGIDAMVNMRNNLVHHLIERFDVWTDDGCTLASDHLRHCYNSIDRHFLELNQWAESMDRSRALSASFAQSDAFHDMLINGIAPDGSFAWPDTGIIRVLREAFSNLAVDGWANLESARVWISRSHSDQTPEKYRCRTWPQVLSESREFDLQYRRSDDGKKIAWYRIRA